MPKDRHIYRKFSNKRVNAKKEGIEFLLSYEEFLTLMGNANVTVDDLHIKGYHLARYHDRGAYSIDNCRFIPYLDNYSEKVISEKERNAGKENLRRYRESLTPEKISEIAKKIADIRRKRGTLIVPDNSIDAAELNRRLKVISNYDKSKRGWVMACSRELGISHTQLRRFIKTQGIV